MVELRMPRKPKEESEVVKWGLAALKWLAGVICGLLVYFANQTTATITASVNLLNVSITSLTTQLKAMELHQIEADKRIAEIETSRKINMVGYDQVVRDVQEMKTTLIQNTMRLQTVSDFVSKHFK